MKKFIITGAIALLFVGVAVVPNAQAEELSVAEQIEALMAQLVELQDQLAKLKGEVRDLIKDGLAEGMTDEDIEEIQELLASDPDIYPEGLVTGYFGPLTKKALMRFQERHQVRVSGAIDDDTKGLLEQYLKEGFGDKIPPGLLRAPGIAKKVKEGLCDDPYARGKGPLCKKWKMRGDIDEDDDDDDDSDDDSNDDDDETDEIEVEIEIEDDSATVSFKYDGEEYEDIEVEGTTLDDILEAIADELDVEIEDLDDELVDEVEDEYNEEMEDLEEEEEQEAMEEAESAMEDAQEDIDDAQDEIDDADADGDDTTEAVAKLAEAQDKLDDAQTKFDAEEYEEAEALADEASDLAKEAEDLAEDAEPLTP